MAGTYARYSGFVGAAAGVSSLNGETGGVVLVAGTGITITPLGQNITIASTSQPAGNYITALTGDGTAAGPGSVPLTLATVNGNVGSFGSASSVGTFTVNAKGLVTAAASTAILITESQVTNLVSDLAGKQPTGNYITALTGDVTASGPGSAAATLATVNSNVGSFGSSTSIPSVTVNAKGLVTAASGNVVIAPAGTLTGATLAANVLASSLTSVGTIATGVWSGTAISAAKGGTAIDTSGSSGIPSIAAGTWSVGNLTGDVTTSARVATLAATANATLASLDKSTGVTVKGTTTNNDAASGYIGEYLSQSRASGSAVSLTTNTNANVTATPLTLTAGDWDISGAIAVTFDATTNITLLGLSISNTSATLAGGIATPDSSGQIRMQTGWTSNVPINDMSLSAPSYRVSLSGSATFYLVVRASFTISTLMGYGSIWARRVR